MDSKKIALKANLRGIRKCIFCGHYNGFRARACKNTICSSSINNVVKKPCWIDAIELISITKTRIFSVRVKEREINLRNFVEITDTTLSTEDENTSIINRNAICYVDTCKYDVRDVEIICKHVKSATVCSTKAEKLEVNRNVIYNLNINQDSKKNLWNLYIENINNIPPLQRLNLYTFVVQCPKNSNFPAGRLHIFIVPDGMVINKLKTQYLCSCKRLKLDSGTKNQIKEPRNENLCFHILFLLTAIIGSLSLRNEFQNFCNLFESLWRNNIIDKFQQNLIKSKEDNEFPATKSYSKIVLSNVKSSEIKSTSSSNMVVKNSKLYDMECDKKSKIINMEDCSLVEGINLFNNEMKNLNENDFYNLVENELLMNVNPDESNNVIFDLNSFSKLNNTEHINKKQCIVNKNEICELLSFNVWLNFVIEKINQSICFNNKYPKIIHEFNIHQDFFTLLHNKFSLNNHQKRLPNAFHIIKIENKNLIKHMWIFSTKSVLKNIFKTETSSIIFEKEFIKDTDKFSGGRINKNANTTATVTQYRKIKPKTKIVFIRLANDTNNNFVNTLNFKIEWIPNVYPESKFGILKISYNLDFKMS